MILYLPPNLGKEKSSTVKITKITNLDEDGILPPNLGKNYSFCMAFKNLQDWTIIFYLHPNLSKKSHNVRMKKIHQFGP